MLVTLNEVLKDARKNKYGVGLFNTVNLEMAKGVLAAAEETKSPVIIGTAEIFLPQSSLEELAYFLIPMAKKATVPVVLHFDHGLTEENIMKALNLGFSSVMYDCSTDPYDVNVQKVAAMVKAAKIFGATVEGELGHVGANSDDAAESHGDNDDSIYTEPEQAKDFVEKTGVDALAVAIGTAHGAYKSKPKLDINRLKIISETVDVPLVLHGGSGLTDDDFKNCVHNGISKINIFTDINCACAKSVVDNYQDGLGMTDVMLEMIDAVKRETIKKMNIFGSPNHG